MTFAEAEFIETPAEQRDARAFATARIAHNAEEYPQPVLLDAAFGDPATN